MKNHVTKHLGMILLLAGLTACAKSGATPPASAEVLLTPAATKTAAGIAQLQDLDGYWKLDNSNELILFSSNFEASLDCFETRVAGLNAEKDFGYRFYGLAEGDRLKLEKLEQKDAYGAMVLRVLNGGKKRVLKIRVVPTDANVLTIEFVTKDKAASQKFTRALNQEEARAQYLREQTDLAWAHIREKHAGASEACKQYVSIERMPFETNCLKKALEADPRRAKDPELFSAAVTASNLDMVDLLLSFGADINAEDHFQKSPISRALEPSGHAYGFDEHGIFSTGLLQADMIEKLVKLGAKLNPENGKGVYVLPSLISHPGVLNDNRIFELLLEKGAKLPEDASHQAFSTFFYDYNARWGNQGPVIINHLIKELGADPNYLYSDNSGGVLSFAVAYADVDALKTLAANGADFKARTGWKTALAIAEDAIAKQRTYLLDRTNTNLQNSIYQAEIKRLQVNEAYLKSLGL